MFTDCRLQFQSAQSPEMRVLRLAPGLLLYWAAAVRRACHPERTVGVPLPSGTAVICDCDPGKPLNPRARLARGQEPVVPMQCEV